MTEFKNTERELYLFRRRVWAASIFVLICFGILLLRFLWLQVYKHEDYAAKAEDNRISLVPIVPQRGLILDRNGVVLARNYSAYTLEITVSKLRDTLDNVVDELAKLVDISVKDRKKFKKLLSESRKFESLAIRTKLTQEEVARFTAQQYRFPGVEVQARLFRHYPFGDLAAHALGYIGRINAKEAEAIEESEDSSNYYGTHYIGKEGVEKSYEKILHGQTGYEKLEVAASGKAVRSLSRTPAVAGHNLILSLDIELQKVVESAFGERRGALVAIEPATGDVLAYVSKPGFDPNLFVEGIDYQSWEELNTSLDRPLLNRPILGTYPPGSTYKPFMALAALTLGKRTPEMSIRDPGYFMFGNHRFRDDKEGGHGIVDMYKSIVDSCDTYYYVLANDIGVDGIHDFMKPFGFGQITGIDLAHERKGILPSTAWKKLAFRKAAQQKWFAGETVSLAIGQGYNSFTPLQVAHALAILVNNGRVMRPHLVKMVENATTRQRELVVAKEERKIEFKQEHIDFIKQAMVGVTKSGTAAAAFAGTGYESAGKTGTAQVVGIKQGEKYNAALLHYTMHDHSWYIAFAPVDQPKIALAVIVENGGFGATAAAPIARKALDYFLLGKGKITKAEQSEKGP